MNKGVRQEPRQIQQSKRTLRQSTSNISKRGEEKCPDDTQRNAAGRGCVRGKKKKAGKEKGKENGGCKGIRTQEKSDP